MYRSPHLLILFLLVSIFSKANPIVHDTIPSNGHRALPEINIKGNAMVAKRRGDTLVFAADRFKRADAIKLEELLKHVPGFRVDENGRISFNGKEIKKLLGVGGSFKNDQIIIQGDYRDNIMVFLKNKGFKVKRVGG